MENFTFKMTIKKSYFFMVILFLGLGTNSVFAQQKIVTGTVSDSNGITLPGVNIVQQGTENGTVTDIDGNYSIKIFGVSDVLVYSYLGFQTIKKSIGKNSTINVRLLEDSKQLGEVIVIGYGTQKKKDMTGSVVSMNAEEILTNSPVDISQGIQGKIAGVKVGSSSGDPSAASSITIRGINSISAGSTPLYIIDGMPYDVNQGEVASSTIGSGNSSNPLAAINPSDIKSISVLKDASATAIYGSRGANGVILIETKKGGGINGEGVVNFNSYIGVSKVSRKIPVLNGNEFIEYRRDVDPLGYLFYNNGDINSPRDPYALKQHDWQDEILRNGLLQNYNLSLNGRSGKTNYAFSLGYYDNDAIVKNNNDSRTTFKLSIDHNKSEKLNFGLTSSVSYNKTLGATQSGGGSAMFNGVVQNLVISTPVELYNPTFDPGDAYISPSSMIDDAFKSVVTGRFAINAYMNYHFTDDIKLVLNGGENYSSSKGSEFYGKDTNWGFLDNGYSNINQSQSKSYFGSAQLHYTKSYGSKHKFDAFVATEYNNYNYEWFSVTKTNFLDESTGVNDISKGSTLKASGSWRDNNTRISFFGRANYSFNDRHLFTVTFRADGSDKFAEGKRYGYFPSAAYSYIIIDNNISGKDNKFNFAKLRLSYGITGNDRIPSYRYLARLENTYYNGTLGISPSSMANNNLQWETTYQSNFGIDLGFFNNAITASIDVYNKETDNLLMPVSVAGRTGYSNQWQNIGRVDNKGVELQITSTNINKDDFRWITNFNIATNKNEIKKLGNVDFIPIYVSGAWIQDVGRLTVGRSIGEAYGYVFDGVYQLSDFTWQEGSNPDIPHGDRVYHLNDGVVAVDGVNVRPGSHKFKDLNGDGVVKLDDDRTHISRSDPIIFGGITNTFNYKNFDFSFFLQGSYGNEIFNESKYRLEGGVGNTYQNVTKEFYYNHWSLNNPSNKYGDYGDRNMTAQLSSSYYVEDASYVRLQSVSFGYSLDSKFLKKHKVSSLRLYVTGNNLFTWTTYSGFDPELDSGDKLLTGVDRIIYPRSKSVLFGLNLNF